MDFYALTRREDGQRHNRYETYSSAQGCDLDHGLSGAAEIDHLHGPAGTSTCAAC